MYFAVMASKTKTSNSFWYKCLFKVAFVLLLTTHQTRAEVQDDDAFLDTEQLDEIPSASLPETVVVAPSEEEEEILYATPKPPPGSYIAETFDDIVAFGKTWVKSIAKKDAVDADIAKYDGVWAVEEPLTPLLKGDRGLVLKSKAKHAAIAAPLSRPFKFGAKPFVVQYEVNLQDGQECGGAYIKLLSFVEGKGTDLNQFHDKSPYTIMFGPDKCGNDFKLHFIFRHVNPINGSIEEKHAKRPLNKIEEVFKDKRPHLYTLVLRPDNSFDISLDHTIVNSGHLLEDFTPPVNPDKEIVDPEDKKPVDWDEREKIADPDDKKPEDWDDDAPKKIPDPDAAKPSGWLEDEPEMIPDPEAVRPDDWDNEMDGEWEAPLITNPTCKDAPGCGPWSRPIVDNPAYRGKWRARLITNPNYRGQWLPRMVPNPGYFEDLEPFKMTPINAVGFELWSMSENILFDNIIITESVAEARQFAEDTFDLKMSKLEKGKGGVMQRILDYSNERPWLYAVYVLLAAVPVVVIIMCCCASTSDKADEGQAERKKTDAATSDDPDQEGEAAEGEEEEGEAGHDEEEEADEEAGEAEDEEEEEEEEDEDKEVAGADERSSQEEDADEEDEPKDKREEHDSDKQESEDKPSSPRQRRKVRRD